MEIDCLLLMIMICTVSLIVVLYTGIAVIRKDIDEIKNLIKSKKL